MAVDKIDIQHDMINKFQTKLKELGMSNDYYSTNMQLCMMISEVVSETILFVIQENIKDKN